MGLILHLADIAGITIKHVGGLDLIAHHDVETFLRVAENRGVCILGIEGFCLDGTHVVPDMNAIADFSGLPHDDEMPSTTIAEARRFLLEVSRPEMYFDFAIQELEGSD